MLCPALSVSEIEDMTIKEITSRVEFLNNIKTERERTKSRDFFILLTDCIASGTNSGTTGKMTAIKELKKNIGKLFSKKDKQE